MPSLLVTLLFNSAAVLLGTAENVAFSPKSCFSLAQWTVLCRIRAMLIFYSDFPPCSYGCFMLA